MMGGFIKSLLLLLVAITTAALPEHQNAGREQQVLNFHPQRQGNPRKLRGRFLHITDFHPDPFYKIGADPDGDHPCHKGTGGSEVGYYGAATTDCDTPFSLVNATFKWIEENIREEIDFVIWTGDSARHDNDDDIPRSTKQIEELNEYIVSKFVETFGKPDNIDDPDPTNDFVVPIVPTYGNNDILPHNIFTPGPNRWTKKYLDIWAKFVPPEQHHSFARGGWFFTEVIPNRLAVFSLNTLYFFDNNGAVDGCDEDTEPGYEHFEWLRIQLQFLRERKMKAILMGHVPPAHTESKRNWDETCHQKYTLWLRQYRDVIVANIFGHMNIDHFMFQDVEALNYKFEIDGVDGTGVALPERDIHPGDNEDFHAMAKVTYINDLRDEWASLPAPPKGMRYLDVEDHFLETAKSKKSRKERQKFLKQIGGKWAERFSMSIVSPSIVPNFFPTLRIIEYNMTGLEHDHPATGRPLGTPAEQSDLESFIMDVANDHAEPADDASGAELDLRSETDINTNKKKKKKNKNKKKHGEKPEKPNFPVPKPPSSTTPPGPAYSTQTFSFLSWTQLYANLTKIHEKMSSKDEETDEKEELTYEPDWLAAGRVRNARRKGGKGKPNVKDFFDFKVEYTTQNDSIYKLRDLTVRSWLDLAERIGRTEYKKPSAPIDLHSGTKEETDAEEDSLLQRPDRLDVIRRDYDFGMVSKSDVTLNRVSSQSPGNDGDVEIDKKKKKKKKKHRKKHGRLKKNRLWHTFVTRVFVQTKSEKDLEDDFD